MRYGQSSRRGYNYSSEDVTGLRRQSMLHQYSPQKHVALYETGDDGSHREMRADTERDQSMVDDLDDGFGGRTRT